MLSKDELDALYLKGLKEYDEGNYAEARPLFRRGAALGDTAAMNAIGLMYDRGAGVEQDKIEAIKWFKKAYRKGDLHWSGNTALTYAEIGQRRRAIYWWRKSIARNDGDAALALAKFLLHERQGRVSKQILDLLRMAADSKESFDITPAGKEEAEELLEKLSVSA